MISDCLTFKGIVSLGVRTDTRITPYQGSRKLGRFMKTTGAVYGEVLGEAREKHVEQALKRLYASGISEDTGVGKGIHDRVLRPGPNALAK